MWYDELPGNSWTNLWSGYVVCGGGCAGIRKIDESCPACHADPFDTSPETVTIDGREVTIHATFMGAEGRYEDYVYLQMLQREWERPAAEFKLFSHFADAERPSGRAALVLLFWVLRDPHRATASHSDLQPSAARLRRTPPLFRSRKPPLRFVQDILRNELFR
jgi:hypothetical protein